MHNLKKAIAFEILFLILVCVSSIHCFDIGRWKGYVRMFGAVQIFVLLAAIVFFIVRIMKKHPSGYTPLLSIYGILCVMQLFPMIGAVIIISSYRYAAAHLIILGLGIFNTALLTRSRKNLMKA